MIRPREYMDGLRRCAARVERAAGEIGRAAQQGRVPDAATLDELRAARSELVRLRDELNAALGRLSADWADSGELTLDQLESRVDEWELRERMGAGIVGRIGDAAARLERVHAPGCGIVPVRELARQAAAAFEERDMKRLSALEDEAMPYLDMCVLLSGDVEAVKLDGELLRRLEKWYPQVVWYVRARMRLMQDRAERDRDGERVVAKQPLFEARAAQAGPGSVAHRPTRSGAAQANAANTPHRPAQSGAAQANAASAPHRPTPPSAAKIEASRREGAHDAHADEKSARPATRMLVYMSVSMELERRLNALSGSELRTTDWRALAADYPEIRALKELAALNMAVATRDQLAALVQRAQAQARAYDDIVDDACANIGRSGSLRPGSAAVARAWGRLMAPGRGELIRALDAVALRRRAEYDHVSALCGRLLIDGLANGLYLRELSALAPELRPDELVELVRLVKPVLLVLGRWRALLAGEPALRMGRIRHKKPDCSPLTVNEQYAGPGAREIIWGAQGRVFRRRK